MRVLLVSSEWPTADRPDNAAYMVREVEFLRRAGIDVEVYTFRGAGDPRRYFGAWRDVRRRVRANRFDLIHAHFGQAGVTGLASGLPLVVTMHGSDLQGIVGDDGRYTMRGRVLRTLSRFVARLADRVIVVSDAVGRNVPRSVRYTVIPLGVDLDVFRELPNDGLREELGLDPQRKLVLFAGRPDVPVKRYELARSAIDLLHDIDASLIVVSRQPPDTVAKYMNACDALLVTSLHEGSPTMVKEALACNLPVVSVDVGDVRARIRDVPGCTVVSDDQPQTIAAALRSILIRGGRADGSAAVAEFDATTTARRVIDVYEEALAR